MTILTLSGSPCFEQKKTIFTKLDKLLIDVVELCYPQKHPEIVNEYNKKSTVENKEQCLFLLLSGLEAAKSVLHNSPDTNFLVTSYSTIFTAKKSSDCRLQVVICSRSERSDGPTLIFSFFFCPTNAFLLMTIPPTSGRIYSKHNSDRLKQDGNVKSRRYI